jgi:regulator of RNase E activity RraB
MKLFDRFRKHPEKVIDYRELDALTIRQLRDAGSDMSKPHAVEHFLYFPQCEQAQAAVDRMNALGFDAALRDPAPGFKEWLAFGTRRLVITDDSFAEVRAQLTVIAEEFGGDYDGWGAPIET